VRVAVLGLGSIGLRHARNLVALGQEVVGFDPLLERREALEEAGGKTTEDRAALIKDADAVVVASPNVHHLDDLRAAIEAGRPAFVEKPLSHKLDGVDAVLAQADKMGVAIFAALNLRFHPAVQEAKRRLAAGDIGKPLWGRLICSSYLPNWRPNQDYRQGYTSDPTTGGVLFDIVHEFDLAHHLLGAATAVAAQARRSGRLEMSSEDVADVLLRHASGVTSSLHLDYVTRPPLRVTEIAGEDGFLRLDIAGRRATITDAAGAVKLEKKYVTTFDDDYRDEMAAFLACVAGQDKPPCNGREARDVLVQVVAARRLAGLPQS
jgi:predicted dehydrogenase